MRQRTRGTALANDHTGALCCIRDVKMEDQCVSQHSPPLVLTSEDGTEGKNAFFGVYDGYGGSSLPSFSPLISLLTYRQHRRKMEILSISVFLQKTHIASNVTTWPWKELFWEPTTIFLQVRHPLHPTSSNYAPAIQTARPFVKRQRRLYRAPQLYREGEGHLQGMAFYSRSYFLSVCSPGKPNGRPRLPFLPFR